MQPCKRHSDPSWAATMNTRSKSAATEQTAVVRASRGTEAPAEKQIHRPSCNHSKARRHQTAWMLEHRRETKHAASCLKVADSAPQVGHEEAHHSTSCKSMLKKRSSLQTSI
eukprot:scaffold317715_cov38-Tisochrysis_lutea.AAC.2